MDDCVTWFFHPFVFSILFVAQLQLFIVIHYGRNWANISSILELFFNSSSSIIPHSSIVFHLLCNLPKKLSISHNLIDGENCKILNKTQLPKGRNPQGTSSPPTISWIKMFFFHLHLPMFPVARHLLTGKAIISLRQMASNALPWGKFILTQYICTKEGLFLGELPMEHCIGERPLSLETTHLP